MVTLEQGCKNAVAHLQLHHMTKNLQYANRIGSNIAVFAVSPLALFLLASLISFLMFYSWQMTIGQNLKCHLLVPTAISWIRFWIK